jgi:signal transduction histidine kinase
MARQPAHTPSPGRHRDHFAHMMKKYRDLYDFAPVGYFLLDDHDAIQDVNLTGARMLNSSRAYLKNMRFSKYILNKDLELYTHLRTRAWGSRQSQSCELAIVTRTGRSLEVHLDAAAMQERAELWITATDVSDPKKALRARRAANRNTAFQIHARATEPGWSQPELRDLAAQTIDLLEKEKRNISLELHDKVAQGLVTIKLFLENTLMQSEVGPASSVSLEAILEMTRRILQGVRRLMNNLRPKMLDELGLLPTLRWYWQEFEHNYSDIAVKRNVTAREESIPEELKLVIYRITQQAAANIVRQSKASRVDFELIRDGRLLILQIVDNGAGCKMQPCPEHLQHHLHKSLGIVGMRERASLTRGHFRFRAQEGGGNQIRVTWDLGL